MNDYKKIDWAEVRAGDVLMHENGDRLRVSIVSSSVGEVHVSGVWRREESLRRHGFTPHRRVEPVPTEPGAYHDRDGVLCVLAPLYEDDPRPWMIAHEGMRPYWVPAESEHIAGRGPFTRMVPMPTEAEVLDAIESPELLGHRTLAEDRAAAVMVLLGGGDDV